MKLAIDAWMVGWSPDTGEIEVGLWPDERHWSARYELTTGCCETERHEWSEAEKLLGIFRDFHLIVLDGIDPKVAHREFLKIAAYHAAMPPELLPDGEE